MTPIHNGKCPSKFWNFRHKTGAFVRSLAAKTNRGTAKAFALSGGTSAGAIYGGIWLFSNVTFFGMPSILLGAGLLVGALAGRKSWLMAKDLKRSSVYRAHMDKAGRTWVENQTRQPLVVRIKAGLARIGAALGFTAAGAGLTAGVAAGLQMGGAIALPVLTAVSLPVVIGVGAAVAAIGTLAGFAGIRKGNRLLNPQKATTSRARIEERKTTFRIQPISNDFQKQSKPYLDDASKAAAERRKNRGLRR
jgi:hypothetical protein